MGNTSASTATAAGGASGGASGGGGGGGPKIEHEQFWVCSKCLCQSNRQRIMFCAVCLSPRDDVRSLISAGPLTADEVSIAPHVFVVGVGGASRSGKSTLSRSLSQYFHTPPPLCVDSYFVCVFPDPLPIHPIHPISGLNCICLMRADSSAAV